MECVGGGPHRELQPPDRDLGREAQTLAIVPGRGRAYAGWKRHLNGLRCPEKPSVVLDEILPAPSGDRLSTRSVPNTTGKVPAWRRQQSSLIRML
jgi:hypothetical protein